MTRTFDGSAGSNLEPRSLPMARPEDAEGVVSRTCLRVRLVCGEEFDGVGVKRCRVPASLLVPCVPQFEKRKLLGFWNLRNLVSNFQGPLVSVYWLTPAISVAHCICLRRDAKTSVMYRLTTQSVSVY
jgi:hypothetical protein